MRGDVNFTSPKSRIQATNQIFTSVPRAYYFVLLLFLVGGGSFTLKKLAKSSFTTVKNRKQSRTRTRILHKRVIDELVVDFTRLEDDYNKRRIVHHALHRRSRTKTTLFCRRRIFLSSLN